ncbi:hypothetical protein F2Q69_00056191 [Brassica cretica]|uniref:NAC domain-containing protein n=1 Tax=Brassica cretica TaxID=69181 RepID=A0A8S9MUU5_BRACR|nr:hypothetical protein F2Q69_00056191 [Brassica cretica]
MADGDDGEDLLGLDLMELEDRQPQLRSLQVLGRRSSSRSSRTKKLGTKRSAPLGINRKFEILRRGSPSKRSTATVSHRIILTMTEMEDTAKFFYCGGTHAVARMNNWEVDSKEAPRKGKDHYTMESSAGSGYWRMFNGNHQVLGKSCYLSLNS